MDTQPTRPPPGKRGRRQGLPDPEAGPVAALGYELTALKLRAGDPSYETMRSQLGAMASKSALSAAARGRDLPSWETVWEFVRCLAGEQSDPDRLRAEWRGRWESARAAVEGVDAQPAPPPAVWAAAVPPHDVLPTDQPGARPADRPSGRGRERRLVMLGLGVGATVGGLIWLLIAAASPAAPPVAGDAAAFVADVTVPDGTTVRGGTSFVKTWAVRNTGTVAWTGRYLLRLPSAGGGECRTPERVPVPVTAPGVTVQLSVTVDVASGPAHCKVYWKMVDDRDRPFFPLTRPMFFDVRISG